MPTLPPGSLVVVMSRSARVGDVVIARAPSGREIVKRVERIDAKGYFVVGDNRLDSTDSREFGSISKSAILGVVGMKITFATATAAKPVKNAQLLVFPYAAALLLLLFVLAQLVTFDKLQTTLEAIAPGWGKVWIAVISLSEVFALPFLLRMRMSRLARCVSLMLGYSVVIEWLILFNFGSGQMLKGVPLFGTLFSLDPVNSLLMLILLLALTSISHVILGGEPALKLPRRLRKLKK